MNSLTRRPRLVEELGHQKDAIERQIAALKKSHPEFTQANEGIEEYAEFLAQVAKKGKPVPPVIREVGKAADETTVEIVDLTIALEKFGLIAKQKQQPIHDLGSELEWLETRFDKVQTVPIGDFLADLGVVTKESGIEFHELNETVGEVEQSSKKLDVTLAALAGQMGGAAGQALNLAASMIQTNDGLAEGRKNFQRLRSEPPSPLRPFTPWGMRLEGRLDRFCRRQETSHLPSQRVDRGRRRLSALGNSPRGS